MMVSKVSHCIGVFLACLLIQGGGTVVQGLQEPDQLVVVVSRDNPVQSLSKLQIEDIFLGKSAVFPDGRRAVPVDNAEGSVLRTRFYTEVLGRTAAQIRAHWSRLIFTGRGRPPRSVSSVEELLQIVAKDPQSIGYIERHLVTDAVRVVLE